MYEKQISHRNYLAEVDEYVVTQSLTWKTTLFLSLPFIMAPQLKSDYSDVFCLNWRRILDGDETSSWNITSPIVLDVTARQLSLVEVLFIPFLKFIWIQMKPDFYSPSL